MAKPRIVVAGQIPPPYGGQNIMVEKAVAQFAALRECESTHLPFYFTSDVQQARKAGLGKILELLRVIWRLVKIRARGPIEILIYPSGGPQTVPIIRDILLLPWMLLLTRRVLLHFHAAGAAERFRGRRMGGLARLLRLVYRRAAGAIVMAEFNRRDPEFFGLREIIARPHRIRDEFAPDLISRNDSPMQTRLLYVGHLHPDKGTEGLLRAFATLRRKDSGLTLELVGEPLPPWRRGDLAALIRELELEAAVTMPGVLTGEAKARAFGRADLFVFPTIAPYESFGLVLVEAMMWQLPIVASRWRGNEDVLTGAAGGIMFDVDPGFEERIIHAVAEALARRAEWRQWGHANRQIFEELYREKPGELWFADAVLSRFPAIGAATPIQAGGRPSAPDA